jgi:gamma-glutamyltranspeptidase/glutathione hydrolase/leukotriene-C4 hydrolase
MYVIVMHCLSYFIHVEQDRTHPPEYYNPEYDVKVDHGTVSLAQEYLEFSKTSMCLQSHTSVVDKDGMAVALTSTVNLIFGSQVLDPNTGIILNDEMDDFSTPGVPNGFGLWPSPCKQSLFSWHRCLLIGRRR